MDNSLNNLDELTGAFAKGEIESNFLSALEQAKSNNQPLSLASIDIDKFLAINESYGREIGDQVLKSLVEQIVATTPDNYLVYRYGGDEFYIIMPNSSREEALLLMDQIRNTVAEQRSYGSAKLEVKLSIGISSYPIDGTETNELQRKADQALYRAKKEGSNRVLLAYDEKMIPKTVHFTETQLERLSGLAVELTVSEARLLREALDDLISKYTVNKIGL